MFGGGGGAPLGGVGGVACGKPGQVRMMESLDPIANAPDPTSGTYGTG